MLDRMLLEDFMQRFYGYGSWDAPLWFVGMEEGGGNSIEEIQRRLTAWDRSDELAELKEYQSKLGGTNWFSSRPRIQSTWGKLIRVALAYHGRERDTESVREYQRTELGRKNGTEALIELLPLPSPSISHWLYASSGIPSLHSRKEYRAAMVPARTAAIRSRLEKHRPRAVCFYGFGYRAEWEAIAGQPFVPIPGGGFFTATNETTIFVLSPHPASRGVRNSAYDAIGDWVRNHALDT